MKKRKRPDYSQLKPRYEVFMAMLRHMTFQEVADHLKVHRGTIVRWRRNYNEMLL